MNLSVVVPCYNEEAALPETMRRLGELIGRLQRHGKVDEGSKIILVDDGSEDATWALIEAGTRENPRFEGVKLSRNRGHQNALLAGVFHADGDAVVTVDADLQDEPDTIEQMVDQFAEGNEIVYGVRRDRKSDTVFKRTTAQLYYRMLRLFGVEVVHNHGDFRLLSRRAVEALREFGEVNVFIRGIVPLLGYRSAAVQYARGERIAGETKYPVRKMVSLGLDGITSFSAVPLRLIAAMGIAVFCFTVAMTGWVLWIRLFTEQAVPGWASTVIPTYFLGGIQLLSVGVIGEYIAKMYLETKRRPRFFVEKVATSRMDECLTATSPAPGVSRPATETAL